MGAEGEGRAGRLEHAADPQRLQLGQLGEGHGSVRRARDVQRRPALVDDQVPHVGFEQGSRPLPGERHQLLGGLLDRGAALLQAARTERAHAVRHEVGVAVLHGDPLDRDAGLVAGQHRPGGGVPLAVRRGAGQDGGGAVRVDLDVGDLVGSTFHRDAGDLDVHRQADAQLGGVAAGAPVGLLSAQRVVARGGQHPVERSGVVAGVVDRTGRGGVRLGERGEQVASPDLGRVEAGLGSEQVECALDGVCRLRAAGTAVRRDRRGVGDHAAGPRLDPRDVVDGRRHQAGEHGQQPAEPGVGTAVLQDLEAVGEHGAVPPAADRDGVDLGPPVGHRDHVLRAGLRPAHRSADVPGGRGDDCVVRVSADLGPEPPADVGGDDVHVLESQPEPRRDRPLRRRGRLRGQPQGEPTAVVGRRRRRPALHRRDREALVVHLLGDDHLAAVEQVRVRGIGAEGAHRVRAGRREEQHLVGSRLPHVDDGGQRVVLDLDEVRGVLTLVGQLGEYDGDRVADEPDDLGGQQRAHHGRVVHRQHRGQRGQAQIGGRQHRNHPGGGPGSRAVEGQDPGVRDRGPDEGQVQRALEPGVHEIVGVDAPRGQQYGVFDPDDPSSQNAHGDPCRTVVGSVAVIAM